MHLRLRVILTAVQNLVLSDLIFIESVCRPLGDRFLDTIRARGEEAVVHVGSSEEAQCGLLLQHSVRRLSKSASVPLRLQGAVVVEQMDWTRKLQLAGQMNAVLTLVADGVQVGKRQRAKNLGPNLQKCEASAAQLSKSRSGARGALLGVPAMMR